MVGAACAALLGCGAHAPLEEEEELGRTVQALSPTGTFDAITCDGRVEGWSYDPDQPSQSNQVRIYLNGDATTGVPIGGPLTTNLLRAGGETAPGVTGNQGFSWLLPGGQPPGGRLEGEGPGFSGAPGGLRRSPQQ